MTERDIGWRFLFAMMLAVAAVSLACGAFIGAMLFSTTCRLAPDAPRDAYTRPVLICDVPPWMPFR